ELLANKDRRNCLKTLDKKLARAMIPDITVTNLKYNIEFLIIENGKLQSVDDKKKELNDIFESCMLLHDMLCKIYNGITFYNAQSVKVQ
ncbi:5125_t:CDS:1, partial [Racocetra persica]